MHGSCRSFYARNFFFLVLFISLLFVFLFFSLHRVYIFILDTHLVNFLFCFLPLCAYTFFHLVFVGLQMKLKSSAVCFFKNKTIKVHRRYTMFMLRIVMSREYKKKLQHVYTYTNKQCFMPFPSNYLGNDDRMVRTMPDFILFVT